MKWILEEKSKNIDLNTMKRGCLKLSATLGGLGFIRDIEVFQRMETKQLEDAYRLEKNGTLRHFLFYSMGGYIAINAHVEVTL